MDASLSEQENLGLLGDAPAMPHRALAGCGAGAAATPPFRFSTPRQLIDWRALHALDMAAMVRDTDIDALEGVLDIVAHGDMEGEDARHLTPANAARAFRVAQLAVDYLLHVQDRLAADACSAKVSAACLAVKQGLCCSHSNYYCVPGGCYDPRGDRSMPPSHPAQGELGKAQRREQLLQLKVKELREELAGSRKEVRHLKKAAKTLEVGISMVGQGGWGRVAFSCTSLAACCLAGIATAGFSSLHTLLGIVPCPRRRWRWLGSLPRRHRPSSASWSGWWRCPTQQLHAGRSGWKLSWRIWRRSA